MVKPTEKANPFADMGLPEYFEKVLNAHGFSFQFAVLRRAQELSDEMKANWRLEVTEMPTGTDTHVDFILRHGMRGGRKTGLRIYLVAECKRVDPQKSNWYFARNPHPWRNPIKTRNHTQFDQISMYDEESNYKASTRVAYSDIPSYDLPFVLKKAKPSDPLAPLNRSDLSSAIIQVLRAQKGYIKYLVTLEDSERRQKLSTVNVFIPVVFTTAELFSTEINLSTANIITGDLLPGSVNTEKRDWIWFNQNRSVDLVNELPFRAEANPDYDRYYRDFSRSIAIVGSSGIDSFLTTNFSEILDW